MRIIVAVVGLTLVGTHSAAAKSQKRALRIDITTSKKMRVRVRGIDVLVTKSRARVWRRGFQLDRLRRALGKPTHTGSVRRTTRSEGLYSKGSSPPAPVTTLVVTQSYAAKGLVFRNEHESLMLSKIALTIYAKTPRGAAVKKPFRGALWLNGKRVDPTKRLTAVAARSRFRLYGLACSSQRKQGRLVSVSCAKGQVTLHIAVDRRGAPISYELSRVFDAELTDLPDFTKKR